MQHFHSYFYIYYISNYFLVGELSHVYDVISFLFHNKFYSNNLNIELKDILCIYILPFLQYFVHKDCIYHLIFLHNSEDDHEKIHNYLVLEFGHTLVVFVDFLEDFDIVGNILLVAFDILVVLVEVFGKSIHHKHQNHIVYN